ncbi:MAG: family 65 glycosyl hydrolase domain-containing protein [Sphingobacterium sp.]|uniref:family 65 glycosyl hydrolase domain-containing protein n=1 Tax=Sphingobacterium sp. JB170 TaxID=1434842 RepID=UPI00097F698D|nr:family 65 glycosyl hydrolase domain-containing protein [Sphingobacterium sp. JB170]SJN35553.1 Maltose phosphorylase / Trehalose phosphorylase [Sphingobacterium sp. JB170]
MKNNIKLDPWHIIEEEFPGAHNELSESIFSIGNGRMGQRANFEEGFSGNTLQGSYIAGVYYPDKTRVGWWKNGYPEYFAKVINSIHWIGLDIVVNGQQLDLENCHIKKFSRRLDMQKGVLHRSFVAQMPNGIEIQVNAIRLFHMFKTQTASLQYNLTVLNSNIDIQVSSILNGDVANRDSNYDEKFWIELDRSLEPDMRLRMETKKTNFQVETLLHTSFFIDNEPLSKIKKQESRHLLQHVYEGVLNKDATLTIEKRVAILATTNNPQSILHETAYQELESIKALSFEMLLSQQADAWQKIWSESDIQIKGDVGAQQAIRFNIFHLMQTYTGEDPRLNIGPKGFTGEKYGGVTYWDTEAYCLPFYMATQDSEVAKNLLLYRYQHLQKAIENGKKLGFKGGAALYPMVTINGEECHNEWEITFEEIHRNGAIAFAIYNYVRYTGDTNYLASHGLEVLIAISRFWSQRVNWSRDRNNYVMLGVTGPNEYENNVNNNWYTNTMATWCMEYTLEVLALLQREYNAEYLSVLSKVQFENQESKQWRHIIDNMYYPEDTDRGIFLQQDGFLDKDLSPVSTIDEQQRPLNQHWSWDRILRSCYIKQADVLQGLYFLEDRYTTDTIRSNFEFYEPLTVHESSLSPCVHAILAARLGKHEEAYAFYLRTARLDLDNYNNDTEDGLHITSMAGTWLSIVEGFAGMRVKDGILHFNTFIPKQWESYSFNVQFRGSKLRIRITQYDFQVTSNSDQRINLIFNGKPLVVEPLLTR